MMKKVLSMLIVMCILTATTGVAETINRYEQIPDELLIIMYEEIAAEMQSRGLLVSELDNNIVKRTKAEDIVLHEGKYIIGEEIPAGTYIVTCIEVNDWYKDYMSAMGGLMSLLDEEQGNAYGSYFNALGALAGDPTVYLRIIGAYGNVEKTFDLKKDEKTKIILRENTALEISEGSCKLELQ